MHRSKMLRLSNSLSKRHASKYKIRIKRRARRIIRVSPNETPIILHKSELI